MSATTTEEYSDAITTRTVSDHQLLSRQDHQDHAAEWTNIIDYKLLEWGRDASKLEEDGLIPPTIDAVSGAIDVARYLRDKTEEAPLHIVPTGDGGISFEQRDGSLYITIEIDEDGSIEFLIAKDGRVTHRNLIYAPQK